MPTVATKKRRKENKQHTMNFFPEEQQIPPMRAVCICSSHWHVRKAVRQANRILFPMICGFTFPHKCKVCVCKYVWILCMCAC